MAILDERATAIDVGSEQLHVSIAGGEPKVSGSMTRDIQALLAWLPEHDVRSVAMEATGVYWMYLYASLQAAGLEVLVVTASASGASPRHGMEAQANEFAACLLMSRSQIARLSAMRGSAEIARILTLQELCQVSTEAAARRYAQLHGGDFAIVFTKDGQLADWPVRGGDFPWLLVGDRRKQAA